MKSKEELDELKRNWLEDPCWDIEDTEGFEEHVDELMAFRLNQEKEWSRLALIAFEKKASQIGYMENEIIAALHSFQQIEHELTNLDHVVGDADSAYQYVQFIISRQQVRATLLQAAQTKRLADQVERIADLMDGADTVDFATKLYKVE